MNKKKRFLRYACAVWLMAGGYVQAAPFSIDVNRITYSYGTTNHTLDFSVASNFGPSDIDPATGYRLTWDSLETSGSSAALDGVYRMSIPQATASQPYPYALSAINGWGGDPLATSPSEWQVSALISNIANATTTDIVYEVDVGGGTYDVDGVNVNVAAGWFTGDTEGTHYDNALYIGSDISIAGYYWDSWNSGDGRIFLTDLNPQDTTLELMVDITNSGQTFSSYYKLDGEASWNLAYSHTLPSGVGTMSGFFDSHPYVSIENTSVVPIPAAVWLFGSGLLGLIGVVRRKRQSK